VNKVTKKHYRFSILNNLQPDYLVEDIKQIDEKQLTKLGIQAIAFDADHTLVNNKSITVSPEVLQFLKTLSLPIYIATNRPAPRGEALGKLIGANKVIHATKRYRKPQTQYFRELLSHSNIDLDKTVLVGDRLFTDVLGGNRANLTTIYTKALGEDPWYIKLFGLRIIENLLIKILTDKP
jgi:HAD superfamily phosphatase (TIGR01668 family)